MFIGGISGGTLFVIYDIEFIKMQLNISSYKEEKTNKCMNK